MSRPEVPIALVDLDYAPADEHRTLIRVIARLAAELGQPDEAELLISRYETGWLAFPARAWTHEPSGLWRGIFAVPAAIVEGPQFGFALGTAGHRLPLPHPGFASFDALAPIAGPMSRIEHDELAAEHVARLTGGRMRTRAVALATVLAVTASSSPAAALAGAGEDGRLVGHAQTSQERIEQLAQFAAKRARAQAARRRALASERATRGTHPGRSGKPARGGLTGGRTAQVIAPGAPSGTVSATAPATTPAAAAPTPTTPAATTPTPTTPAATTPTTSTPAPATPTTSTPAPATPVPPAPTLRFVAPKPTQTAHQKTSHPQLPLTLPASAKRSPKPHRAPHKLGPGGTLTPSAPGFLGPKSWTGTVINDPALQSVLGNLSALLHDINQPPRFLIPIYMEAARRFDVPWPVLAAINSVETDYGRNLNTSSAGAIGWMQFEPSTWKQWGLHVDGHNVANPYDPRDAIFSAARYLQAAGAASDISRAIYAYNHATWYVNMVLSRARAIASGVHPHTQTNQHGIISTFFTQFRGHWQARYRGGYLTHYTRLVAAANMVSAANFPYLWGGGHEQPARFGAFDCSGSISYVLQQAGYTIPTVTSGNVPSWHFPAGPGRVTIFYNPGHTFMRIGSRYFGTSGSGRPGGGAGWISTDRLPVSYLATLREVHVPWLHGNAFAARRHRHPGLGGHAAPPPTRHSTRPRPVRLTPRVGAPTQLQLTFPYH